MWFTISMLFALVLLVLGTAGVVDDCVRGKLKTVPCVIVMSIIGFAAIALTGIYIKHCHMSQDQHTVNQERQDK